MKTLYEHADDIALMTEVPNALAQGSATHKVIAVYPSMAEADRERFGYPERDDIHFTSFGGPLLGRRTLNIVAYRGDFLEAFANPRVTDDLTALRQQEQRHFWVTQVLLCRLLPGGRIVLV